MGLLTNSKEIREYVLSKNIYNPDNIYDIDRDVVSSILDAFGKAGFDLRRNGIINALERIEDSTPIVTIGAERLAVEFGRRALDGYVNDLAVKAEQKIGSIFNPNGVDDESLLNFKITTDANQSLNFTNIADKILGRDKDESEINQAKGTLGSDENTTYYYKLLGSGQRNQLKKQTELNYFSLFNKTGRDNLTGDNISNISNFLDGRDGSYFRGNNVGYLDFTVSNGDIENGEINITTQKLFINEYKGDVLLESLPQQNLEQDVLIRNGFGVTDVKSDRQRNSNEVLSNRDIYEDYDNEQELIDKIFLYGEEKTSQFNVDRGLLHYTNNIALKGGNIEGVNPAKHLSHETTEYVGVDNPIVFKGTECRSWTIKNRYGKSQEDFIRFDGLMSNKSISGFKEKDIKNSVIGDSVMPRIFPKSNEDKRRLMFSIENLAFTEKDGIPFECEVGLNGGRLMWFPPYDMKLSESVSVKKEEIDFIGRIEPMYIYGGMSRKATLDFTLIIDMPNNKDIRNVAKKDLAKFFVGCEYDRKPTKVQKTEARPFSDLSVEHEKQIQGVKEEESVTMFDPPFKDDTILHFKNNADDVQKTINNEDYFNVGDFNYEWSLGIDERLNGFYDFLAQGGFKQYKEIIVVGNASSRATDDYNVGLSLRRANRYMNYVIEKYNTYVASLSAGANNKITKSNDDSNYDFKKNRTNNGVKETTLSTNEKKGEKTYTFKLGGENIKFKIIGFGESLSDSAENEQIESKEAITERHAYIDGASMIPEDIVPNVNTVQDTKPEDIKTKETSDAVEENLNVSKDNLVEEVDCYGRFSNKSDTHKVRYGFSENEEDGYYYSPAFHSQTPYDFYNRYTFLHQCTRPGVSLQDNQSNLRNANSLFGKMPVCILRVGDFFHTKIIINSINFDMSDITWDMNPEGQGMQPMICRVSMDFNVIGGQSLEGPINQLQRAVDNRFVANSSFDYKFPNNRPDDRTKI